VALIVNDLDTDPGTGKLIEPDPWAFASGDGSITNVGFNSLVTNEFGGGHEVHYMVEFDTPGMYYLYLGQHSPVGPEPNRNQNDSSYYPTEFGIDPI